MHNFDELKDMLCDKLDEQRREKLTSQSLDVIHKLTDTIKNLSKIEMLEEASEYDDEYSGRYSRGASYARRRDSRGRYSRDDRSSYRRGYSRGDAKDELIDQMEDMMNTAPEHERQAIRTAMSALKNM